MISHKYKCIFVHLRRTGGNSIETALDGIVLLNQSGNPTKTWNNQIHRGKSQFKQDNRGHYIHSSAAEIEELRPKEFKQYFRFSFARNPWEQMINLFLRLNPQASTETHFKSWLQRYNAAKGTVPSATIYDSRGNCLVDFVGRFESFQQDFDTACKKLGIPHKFLPSSNASNK